MPLYVVKQTFKAGGKVYLAGSLLEDLSGIKLAKIRLNEGKLVEIPSDEKKFESLAYYLKMRAGTDLKTKIVDFKAEIAARDSKGSESAGTKKTGVNASPPPPGTPVIQPQVVKPLTGNPAGTPVTPIIKK